MKCIILAAGFGTRTYPLNTFLPKLLFKIDGMTLLEYMLIKIQGLVSHAIIYTNKKYYYAVVEEVNNLKKDNKVKINKISVLHNNVIVNEKRKGVINDLKEALLKVYPLEYSENLLILASDNIYEFSFNDLYKQFIDTKMNCICGYKTKNIDDIRNTGTVHYKDIKYGEITLKNIALSFEEKPDKPKFFTVVPPAYMIKKDNIEHIYYYCNTCDDEDKDSLGKMMEWFIKVNATSVFEVKNKKEIVAIYPEEHPSCCYCSKERL